MGEEVRALKQRWTMVGGHGRAKNRGGGRKAARRGGDEVVGEAVK